MTAEEAEVFVFPASFAQLRLWFLDQLFPNNASYNVAAALRLAGSLNLAALEETFNEIVSRHEALRTTFRMLEGQPVQVIAPSLTIPLPVVDLRSLGSAEQETEIRRVAIQEQARPFDLSQGPLLRVMLLQLNSSENILLLNLHHIVCDGWSIGVLIRELGTLYTAFASNQPSPLPPLLIQYADFSDWQREWLQEAGATHESPLQTQLTYWKNQLSNLPQLILPTDRLRPATPTHAGARQILELPKSLSEQLETLSQRQGVTLFMTLLAAFQTLLYRYTQLTDIAVGSPIANRNRQEIEGLIGFFVNSLVLRTDLSGNPTFLELLSRVRKTALGAYAHQDLPFEKLVEELHPERNLSHHPLFQVVFSLQNTPIEALKLPGLTLSQLEFNNPSAKFDLEFHLWESPQGLRGQVVYSCDLFDDDTITRMLGHYQTLLESIVINPEQRLNELPLLTSAEQQQLLNDWNDTSVVGAGFLHPKQQNKGQNFHQLFEAQAEQTPDVIAVVFENEQLTYRQLNSRANQLAHYLQKLGVAPDVLVGICLERSVEMIIGLLAILKAGGAYVPLDPTYPLERLHFMLEDSQVSLVLTHSVSAPLFYSVAAHKHGSCGDYPNKFSIINLDKDWEIITQQSQLNLTSCVTADNLAYVIYTSGSTGKPKGVLVQHRGLSNLAKAQIQTFNLQPNNRVLQFASLSFDASIFEIVMALGTGATLYLAKKESLLPGQPLIQLLKDNAITHVTLPPAVLAVLPSAELPTLQTIISAGEACSSDSVKRWAEGRQFFNAYGPTEATVWATIAEINAENTAKLSIGRPITNTQVYILDAQLQPVPIGVPGELYIGGDGIARGYLNRPELTAEHFIPNPFVETHFSASERLYKTGDLARYQPDGNIEFLGRIDNQVKIRGFRIELGEIEAVLRQHSAVQEAVVIVQEVSAEKRLVAYVVPDQYWLKVEGLKVEGLKNDLQLANLQPVTYNLQPLLRQFLKEKMPGYMMPSAFVFLDSLALTANGKVDRHNLPKSEFLTSQLKVFVAPRTSAEEILVNIWTEVLNLERVGIQDNFFELGGDSLLTVRLIDQIQKQFEQELPLSVLFLKPTIEGLASTLEQGTDSLPWSPLVAIQPAGSNPPFFCVHPIFGVVFPYYELAYQLGSEQPFYGLQPLGLDGKSSPLNCIEDIAAYYIQALRTVQPEGPYFLGGWSFGGLVAFEIAQQLERSGHQVALLAILDTLAPISGNVPSFSDGLKFLLTTVTRDIWSFFLDYFYLIVDPNKRQNNKAIPSFLDFNKLFQWLRNKELWDSLLGEAIFKEIIPQASKEQILSELKISQMLRVYQANNQAILKYEPQAYSKPITLLRTSVESSIAHQHPTLGWSQLAKGGVDVHWVPGNHLTMLRKPHVQILAAQLRECIENAST